MSDYDPVESLREEVNRFKDTNRFSPMTVTHFLVQAGLVLTELDRCRSKQVDLLARVKELEVQLEKANRDKDAFEKDNTKLQELVLKGSTLARSREGGKT